MINKVTPRKLNPSLDSRLRKKDEMLDALNVEIKSDNDGDSGDVGVLKPIKGMSALEASLLATPGSYPNGVGRRVIGSVTDNKNDIIFYFLFSEDADEQGVYAYDPNGVLSNASDNEVIKTVYRDQLFNFPQNGFVKADVVYTVNHEVCNLYFTDNVNEPRRLDVRKAFDFTSNSSSYEDLISRTDFITACPKTPMHPIRFEFGFDASLPVTEFRNLPGFQFAYQCIYDGGEESAISTYSEIAVPPSYIQQGTLTSANLLAHNSCNLTIPKNVNGVDVYSSEVSKIRILGRIGNDGGWYMIDEVDTTGGDIEYAFRNDRVLSGVPLEDVQKQYTSLPRVAEAQTVVDNRLYYGNYVEGFDEPEVQANMSINYVRRPEDFLNLYVELDEIVLPNVDIDYGPNGMLYATPDPTPNRRSGYLLKTDQLPNEISANSVIQVNLTVHPERYFRIYDTEGGASHHSSKVLFGAPTGNLTGKVNEGQIGGQGHLQEKGYFFGKNEGVLDGLKWTDDTGAEVDVVCGTSASNPVSIQAKTLVFKCRIRFNEEVSANGRVVLRNAICQAITGGSTSYETIGADITVLDSKSTQEYSFNVGLSDEDGIDEIPTVGGDDFRKNLINAVGRKESVTTQTGFERARPCGYFIIESADVSFSLRRSEAPQQTSGNEENGFLYLNLDSLTNVVTRNCAPRLMDGGDIGYPGLANFKWPFIGGWYVYRSDYAASNPILTEEELIFDYDYVVDGYDYSFANVDADTELIRGYISSDIVVSDSFISLVDGEAGPRGVTKGLSYQEEESAGVSSVVVSTNASPSDFDIDPGNITSGSVNLNNAMFGSQESILGFSAPAISFYSAPDVYMIWDVLGQWNHDVFKDSTLEEPGTFYTKPHLLEQSEIDDEVKAQQVEVIDFNSFLTSGATGGFRSFKTHAVHDFGIVYYDERGRPGNVNFLPSVYVPGYSGEERSPSTFKGRVEVGVQLNSSPPPWAHHYQVVYAGNSSVSRFIQYTVGGAFIEPVDNVTSETVRNIYVSLNYLQGHPISYSLGFGAVSPEGINELYTFKTGDRLRVISYYTDDDDRIWPRNYDFEIVDSVILSSEPDDNPIVTSNDLSDGSEVPEEKTGSFLILKNNTAAYGFTYSDVSLADGATLTNSHHWNDRCVVEIYTPLDRQDSEDRIYYEIGKPYNVITTGVEGVLAHQTNPIRLTDGDVWWRRAPVNMPDFDSNNNLFLPLITSASAESNFRDYYVESMTFNDTLPNARQFGWGKAKSKLSSDKARRLESSITYSDKNSFSSKLVRFTSFNPAKFQFKDLPAEHGTINSILNYSDSLFCIQEEKISAIPVDRTLLSDAAGSDNLITSKSVLGTQRYFSGNYGCDGDQSSVVLINNFVYFADKSKAEVYRFSPEKGISVISDGGMKQYFRALFQNALGNVSSQKGIRVVGGYDPLKDEFLISVMNPEVFIEPNVNFYEPPTGTGIIDESDVDDAINFDFDEPTGPLSVTFGGDPQIVSTQTSASYTDLVTIENTPVASVISIYYVLVAQSESYPETLDDIILQSISDFGDSGNVRIETFDGDVFEANTSDSFIDTLTPGTDYALIRAAYNGPTVVVAPQVFEFEAQGVIDTTENYDLAITDFSFNQIGTNPVPIGYSASISAFSSEPEANLYSWVVPGVISFDSLGVPIGVGVSFTGVQLFFDNQGSYVAIDQPVTENEIFTVSVVDNPSGFDSSTDHLLVSMIVKDNVIRSIESSGLQAYDDINLSNAPTPLELINEQGLTFGDWNEIFDQGVDSFNSYLSNIQNNPDLLDQFVAAGGNPNDLESYLITDLNFDNITGSTDLLIFLTDFGRRQDMLDDLSDQPGFELGGFRGSIGQDEFLIQPEEPEN